MGTAFDYLLRFKVEQWNPSGRTSDWIAEKALWILEDSYERRSDTWTYTCLIRKEKSRDGKSQQAMLEFTKKRYEWGKRILDEAGATYERCRRTSTIDKRLARSAWRLALLDPIYRGGYAGWDDGRIDPRDIDDLLALVKIVPKVYFTAKRHAVLNPTFGCGSRLVGGADADLLIDDMLIEIKTTQRFRVRQEYLNQLIGYYLLSLTGGIDGLQRNHKVKRLGIYFSRFGELVTFEVDELFRKIKQEPVVRWFVGAALTYRSRLPF